MSYITYREATATDIPRLQELNSQLFQEDGHRALDYNLDYDWSKSEDGAEFYNHMVTSDNCLALVAEHDNEILGYLCGEAKQHSTIRPITVTDLEDMYVVPEHRSRGIGAELISRFLKWSRTQGAKRVQVTTYCTNVKGIDFYKRNGFSEYSITLENNLEAR